jgi:protoporphyrinogen/coproporphyrinogen III oxidase
MGAEGLRGSAIADSGYSVRCAAVAGGEAEAPASTGAQLYADCVVVGGGISGLCTAQALARRHAVGDVLVTEARARSGGNITPVERPEEGYLWDLGGGSQQLPAIRPRSHHGRTLLAGAPASSYQTLAEA